MATVLTRPTPARQDAPLRRQGRSERGGEGGTYRTSCGRSPLEWLLVNE